MKKVYESAHAVRVWSNKPSAPWPAVLGQWDGSTPTAPQSIFERYLVARAHDLFGRDEEAAAHYMAVLKAGAAATDQRERFAFIAAGRYLSKLRTQEAFSKVRRPAMGTLRSELPFLADIGTRLSRAINDEKCLGDEVSLDTFEVADGEIRMKLRFGAPGTEVETSPALTLNRAEFAFEWALRGAELPAGSVEVQQLLNQLMAEYAGGDYLYDD